MRRPITLLALSASLVMAACGGSSDSANVDATTPHTASTAQDATTVASSTMPTSTEAPAPTTPPYSSEVYSDPANWTCRPDMDDTCDDDTSVTMVNADGSTEVLSFTPDPDAPVDCFYAYPTASEDPDLNSDYDAGREREVAFQQAARLSSVCRMFAPTYRSVTLAGLFNPALPGDRTTAWQIPFEDITDAWKHYLANDNQGRGVILLGHSQGTGQLIRLLSEVIDPDPDQRALLVSAIMLGGSVAVPEGDVVGGSMKNIPLCEAVDQTGCIITYASFRDTAPPPADSYFGKPGSRMAPAVPGQQAGCTNPANFGGVGELSSAFETGDWAYTTPPSEPITTPFMGFPGLLTAECVYDGTFSYLKITVNPDPNDARADDITGDLSPQWGLHTVDWELAGLNILDVVRQQIAAFDK